MKDAIRKAALSERNRMSPAERGAKSDLIAERFLGLEEFRSARTVMAYASFGSEVETRRIIEACFSTGKKLALPVVEKGGLLSVWRVQKSTELLQSSFGIPEPPREAPNRLSADEVDLVIVPGIAFDKRGRRVGYGGGYYDRFLGSIRPSATKVALAFEIQLVDEIPVSDRDLPVDVIVTEARTIDCRSAS